MLSTLTLTMLLFFHPVHVTLTSIDHVQGTDSVKVFVRMYYDDFLLDFNLAGKESIADMISSNQQLPEDHIADYINEKVNISINNKELTGKLLKVILADNEISVNLFYRSAIKPEVVAVRNTIMTSLYTDQANMVIIRIGDFEEGVKLTAEKDKQTFSLN